MSDDEIIHDWESDCYVLHAANTHLRDERDRLRAENERLQKYEKLVIYIANDYWELSHDKIKWLYTEYKNKCRKLIEEDNL